MSYSGKKQQWVEQLVESLNQAVSDGSYINPYLLSAIADILETYHYPEEVVDAIHDVAAEMFER